jgi:hypothetical protein
LKLRSKSRLKVTDLGRLCRLLRTMSSEFSTTPVKPKAAPSKRARAKKAPAAKSAAQVLVLGSSKARGGRYQVLAPMIPTRHASADQLDAAVRLVLASR